MVLVWPVCLFEVLVGNDGESYESVNNVQATVLARAFVFDDCASHDLPNSETVANFIFHSNPPPVLCNGLNPLF
ncbi:hypothetical protein J6590_012252 [Homalodisca vitripennis]|nr:hypothetical protein J6590_012252 [Homalodisca vitripennis]